MSRKTQIQAIEHPLKGPLKRYYESSLVDLDIVTNVNFRHFRLRLLEGSFHKVKRKIRTAQDLHKYLIDYIPLDVYYSTATWLNPHIIASRLDKDVLKNIYIGCDLSFDIDVSHRIKTLAEAKTQALAVHDFLDSKEFRVRYCAFSGSKGFHVVCEDPWRGEIKELEPLKRELMAIDNRKKLVKEASTKGLLFDEKVTVDTRRIIRLPGTINSKTGLACVLLTKSELESDIETILKSAKREEFPAPRIPSGEMTAPWANKISGLLGRLGVRPKPIENISYSLYFTSNIPGTQLKIPLMEFEGWQRLSKIDVIIKRTQNQYGLGQILLFSDEERFWAASLKALPRRRVEKILAFSGSRNLNQSKKYGCTYMRVGKSIAVNGKIVENEPRLIKIYEGELKGQMSRTHCEFFSSLGISLKEYVEICGASLDKLEMVHAIVE